MTPRQSRNRYPLLVYREMTRAWLWPSLLLIPGGVLLWWAVPQIPQLDARFAPAGLVLSVAGTLLLFYVLLARRAHVSCAKNKFVIHTPLYPVAFSYGRITMIRPTEFNTIYPPQEEKSSRRRMYAHLWAKTALVVDVRGFPLPLRWLKLWFHPYLLHPKEQALVLLVEDWMALSLQLETRSSEWRERRRRPQEL